MTRPGLAVKLTVLTVAAVLTAAAVLALSSRSDLDGARRSVNTAWAGLRSALDARYRALAEAGDAVEHRLGTGSTVVEDLDRGLAAWLNARSGPRDGQVAAANRLEGLAARLAVGASATPRLRASAEVTAALSALSAADPGDARTTYNGAVARYEEIRGGFPRRLVAGALGFDAERTLEALT